MNPDPQSIPLPKDPRHQRFADMLLSGKSLVDAYLAAGFRCSKAAAKPNASKLRKRADVAAYITAIQQRAAGEAIMNLEEILEFCARVKRTPINKLDPGNTSDPNGDLIKSYTINETETGRSIRIEKHDPFKAIDTHIKLSGQDPEANALNSIAEALGALGTQGALPVDRM